MARKYSYWYIITESFDDRYKQYQRLIWKHPKDVNELFTITIVAKLNELKLQKRKVMMVQLLNVERYNEI